MPSSFSFDLCFNPYFVGDESGSDYLYLCGGSST